MGKRIELIYLNQKKVLIADFSNSMPDQMLENFKELSNLLALMDEKSILVLQNVKGVVFDSAVLEAAANMWSLYKNRVIKFALVGADGLRAIARDIVSMKSGHEMPIFDSLDEALEWLVM